MIATTESEVFGLPYWTTAGPSREYTEGETLEIIEEMRARCAKFWRQFRTAAKIDYCRHRDNPGWRAKVADILARHPEWAE